MFQWFEHHRAAIEGLADGTGGQAVVRLRRLPVGTVPATPAGPTDVTPKDGTSERSLLCVARHLGQPVGYLPEHGGDVVQNLVPTADSAERQTSTSSRVDLAHHTETAFHPHRPHFLVLLCLRGDPAAATTYCTVEDVLAELDDATVAVLRQPRFRCGVDESFGGAPGALSPPAPVIGGDADRPTLWFDADLMIGTDTEAEAALAEVDAAVRRRHRSVVLEAGDCLIIDNHRAVHGRSSFPARFDGTDRWVQRAFVIDDLSAVTERNGRVLTTTF